MKACFIPGQMDIYDILLAKVLRRSLTAGLFKSHSVKLSVFASFVGQGGLRVEPVQCTTLEIQHYGRKRYCNSLPTF